GAKPLAMTAPAAAMGRSTTRAVMSRMTRTTSTTATSVSATAAIAKTYERSGCTQSLRSSIRLDGALRALLTASDSRGKFMDFLVALALHLELADFQHSVVRLYCEQHHAVDLGPPERCRHTPLQHTVESHVTIIVTSSTNSALVEAPPPRVISA